MEDLIYKLPYERQQDVYIGRALGYEPRIIGPDAIFIDVYVEGLPYFNGPARTQQRLPYYSITPNEAIIALHEYCQKNKLDIKIHFNYLLGHYDIRLDGAPYPIITNSIDISMGICLAIREHFDQMQKAQDHGEI